MSLLRRIYEANVRVECRYSIAVVPHAFVHNISDQRRSRVSTDFLITVNPFSDGLVRVGFAKQKLMSDKQYISSISCVQIQCVIPIVSNYPAIPLPTSFNYL